MPANFPAPRHTFEIPPPPKREAPRLNYFSPDCPCIVCGMTKAHTLLRCMWRSWRITRRTGHDAMTRVLLRNVPAG